MAAIPTETYGMKDTEGPEEYTSREYTTAQLLREKSVLVRSRRANRQRGHHPNVNVDTHDISTPEAA